MEKLKPCPFCGGKAKLYPKGNTLVKIYSVGCTMCSVGFLPIFVGEDMAIEAWNKRTETHEERTETEVNIYDEVETYQNCTVEVLKNSVTGETSIGWWKNEN